jgi:hypothetical protein
MVLSYAVQGARKHYSSLDFIWKMKVAFSTLNSTPWYPELSSVLKHKIQIDQCND